MFKSIIILYCYIPIILGSFSSPNSLPGGLKFKGNDHPIRKRTSYNVFHDRKVEFNEYFDIEFKMSLSSDMLIGYIIRIKNEESNKVFNLFYDGNGNDLIFKFNEEGRNSLITAVMNKEELLNKQWFKMKVSFDLEDDSIKLFINNQSFSEGNIGLPDKYYPKVVFGKSDHIIDVPSFAIKDISIGNREKYYFSLREHKGNIVHDAKGKGIGKVSNPEWLINDAYHWKFKASFKSDTVAGANYNPDKKEIYYFNKDSILIYNVRSGEITNQVFAKQCPVGLKLGTNFIDTINSKLYAYEVYYDSLYDGTTVASLDLERYKWQSESNIHLPTQLHHHGSYFIPDKKQYTIFGGFGHMHYSNTFYSYYLDQHQWKSLTDFEGDNITPRYFSSIGYLKKNNSVYIFGGMGNESGDQIVGRRYYYDLYKVDLNTKSITKLWEIPWDNENVVPVRGMVILNDSCFYTLCYPEHFTESFLKLYRFSLKDGNYEILGDSIPIYSDKISTNANLYYDNGHLYAVIQESADDITSNLKIYSLLFPPVTAKELKNFPNGQKSDLFILTIILLSFFIAVGIGYLLIKKLKPGAVKDNINAKKLHQTDFKKKTKPNSIYLFGDFTVRDRNNKDITYLFSSKLKQIFCLILQHSTEDGITSQRLSDLLWPGKPSSKVKNSRGVTLNNLRKILDEIDGIEVIYEQGYFKIVQTEDFYCDYSRCMEIISSGDITKHREELVKILSRGTFLKNSDDPLFDSFKEATEQQLEPILLVEMDKSFGTKSYLVTIALAEAIFNIDPLNETALSFLIKAMQKLKRDEEARIKFQTFVIEYKKIMGTDYSHSFKNLSRHPQIQ